MCYVWLANMTFTLSRDWIDWARGLFATTLRVHRHIGERSLRDAEPDQVESLSSVS